MTWPTGLKQTPEHAAALSSTRSFRSGEMLPWAPACKEDDSLEKEDAKQFPTSTIPFVGCRWNVGRRWNPPTSYNPPAFDKD